MVHNGRDDMGHARTIVGFAVACGNEVGDVRVAIAVALIVALGAAMGGWLLYSHSRATQVEDQKKIAELQRQLEMLQSENTQLKENLAKTQSEEERLSSANKELAKALAQAQLTGKIPPLPPSALPYPPK